MNLLSIAAQNNPAGGGLGNAVILGLEGMAGIFIVMVIISLVVWALPRLSSLFSKNEDGEENKTEDSK